MDSRLRIASKCSRISKNHFAKKGVHVYIFHLYGSMELAPIISLSKANHLKPLESVMNIPSCLIVSKASL